MRLLANIIYLIELLAGAPQLAVRRAARAGREAQARQPHHVVHDDERLGLEQRVGAKLALALALLEPEPMRLDHEIARGDGVGVLTTVSSASVCAFPLSTASQ